MRQPLPISDSDRGMVVDTLRRYPNGLTRDQGAHVFAGNERRWRLAVAAVLEAGEAAIITTDSPYASEVVYRLARTQDEVEAEAAALESRIRHLRARIDGLRRAHTTGPAKRQQRLWDEAAA